MIKLYINGVQAQIDDKTKVSLSYKSPIFSDLQSISANTTYTIKLPLTAYNRGLIENINVVGVESDFAYGYFAATYVSDGIEVISDGTGYLLSVSDCIEICVLFGGMGGVAKLKDAKLKDMPIPAEEGLVQWSGAKYAEEEPMSDIMFLYADYGLGAGFGIGMGEPMRFVHPSVRVSRIWKWINRAYGLNLQDIDNDWVVPCVSKNVRDGSRTPTVYDYGWSSNASDVHRVRLWRPSTAGSMVWRVEGTQNNTSVWYGEDISISISAICVVTKSGISNIAKVNSFGLGAVGGETEWFDYDGESDVAIDIKADVRYVFYTKLADGWNGYTLEAVTCLFSIEGKELTCGEKFDVLYNLPEIKVTDFIKAIMQLKGVFPMLKNGDIGFVSVDDVYANMSVARDWSDRLTEVGSLTFKVDGFAQSNEFVWAEDESVVLKDKAVMLVENKTLAAVGECVKLPFAASDDLNTTSPRGHAIIRLYELVESRDEPDDYKFNSVKPRIIRMAPGGRGTLVGRFDETMRLDGAQGIVATNYSKYAEVIRKPKVAKCKMRLTAVDLAGLDFTVPVYVEQIGGMFAVLSVSTREDFADVELLRL